MNKINRYRIITIGFVWALLGVFLTVYDFWLLKSHLSDGIGVNYTFKEALIFNLTSGLFGGLMGGVVLTIVNRKLRAKPFYFGLVVLVISFVFIVSIITLISAIIPTLINYSNPFSNDIAKEFFYDQILTTMHLKNIIFWALVVAITHFSIQVSNKFGPGNLWKTVTGKYHHPVFEKRIFMFIDLKSSTAIAENLGDDKYHQFLKDVFADITDPIIDSEAEIYQYVGDEVVVSWLLNQRYNPIKCLECFYEIEEELKSKELKYLNRYDVLPRFKAGAHCGQVVAGEIGIIKSDITYSGDVLNTTARIQGQCNLLNSDLLISKDLLELINIKEEKWVVNSKGSIALKGKWKDLELFSVQFLNSN